MNQAGGGTAELPKKEADPLIKLYRSSHSSVPSVNVVALSNPTFKIANVAAGTRLQQTTVSLRISMFFKGGVYKEDEMVRKGPHALLKMPNSVTQPSPKLKNPRRPKSSDCWS